MTAPARECQPEIAVATGDIVKRLRHFSKLFGYDIKPLFEDAADRIEELTKALEPFAKVAVVDIGQDETDADTFQPMRLGYNREPLITVGDMRRAASALSLERSGGAT